MGNSKLYSVTAMYSTIETQTCFEEECDNLPLKYKKVSKPIEDKDNETE